MKAKKIVSALLILCLVWGYHYRISAQECSSLIPVKTGTKMEMKHYNAANQLQSTTLTTVKSKTPTSKGYEVKVDVKSVTPGRKSDQEKSLTFKCEYGYLIWDMDDMMKELLPQAGNNTMKDLEMKFSSVPLKFPAKLTVGQKLDDAEIRVTVMREGLAMADVKTEFVNRKVEAVEKITTPAGTFNCYKITYDLQSKSMFMNQLRQVDWMSEGVGIVKSESYDKSNKLMSYSVLSMFSDK